MGHSTHELGRFIELLRSQEIRAVADVRRHPGSRRHPQFNVGPLGAALHREGIDLEHFGESLGGRRRPRRDSSNGGWRVDAFRGYADHMASAGFASGLQALERLARSSPTTLMCAEADWHRCHRRLIADALAIRGWQVLHIGSDGRVTAHEPTPFIVVEGKWISYPPAQQTLR